MYLKRKLMTIAFLLIPLVGLSFACKPKASGLEVYQVFPGTTPVPPATDSINCQNVSGANPLPAFAPASGWLPYQNQVFCNYMGPHWQQVQVPGHGSQNLEGCNYYLMPENNKKPASNGQFYSNRYYPNEPLFQSWFAVYSVAPMTIEGKSVRVPLETAIQLVYRDNVAWAQWMGDPDWETLWNFKQMYVGAKPNPVCTTKDKSGNCILWKVDYAIASHLDMGCCNWTAGTISNSWKVYHSPEISCYPNPCKDSPTGDCGDPRKNCSASRCDSCVSDIWRDQVENYQKNVQHPIMSYMWYVGDALMVSIATGAVFKKKGATVPTNTFVEFPGFVTDLKKMTKSITVYYDSTKPFNCNSVSYKQKWPAPVMPPRFFPEKKSK